MKKMPLTLAGCILIAGFTACNGDSGSTSTTNDSGSTMSSDTSNASSSSTNQTSTTTPPVTAPSMPLNAADSTFVMKAAAGGMMEVESSNVALQNSQNERVKAFANMMIADHTKANQELMALAGSKGATPPSMLPADKQKHIDDMKAMKGKSFDQHYLSMMTSDHKKTIADFEKQASSGADADLKAWATKTLPTLKMHADSVMAISKMK